MPAHQSPDRETHASLKLLFLRDNAGYKLIETSFTHPELTVRDIDEKTSRIGAEGFRWRKGVMATALFFLRSAEWELRGRGRRKAAAPVFEGPRGSVAASFDTVLSGHVDWASEMFGVDKNYCLLHDLVKVWNAGFRTMNTANVQIRLNENRLPADRIVIAADGGVVDDPALMDAIAENIELQFHRNEPSGPRGSRQTAAVSNVPVYLRNVDFTGRSEALDRLRENLPAGGAGVVVITGLGGLGKTQLAAEYARQSTDRYSPILWVRSATPDVLAQQFAALADVLDLPERDDLDQSARIDAVGRWLQHHQHWLLVFDSAPSKDVVSRYLPFVVRGHVIITSHHPEWDGMAVSIRLAPFTKDESVAFFRKRVPAMKHAVAAELSELLGHLPLALRQVAAYLVETGCSPESYIELFHQRHEELWKEERSRIGDGQTIATTWLLALKEVERESQDAADLMRLCAFLGTASIPSSMLVAGRRHVPQPLRATLGDPVRLNAAIRSLRQFSLMEATDSALAVHRLVQTVVRDTLEPRRRRTWATAALRLTGESIPFHADEEPTWPVSLTVLPHALAALDFASRSGRVQPKDECPPKLFQAICSDVAGSYEEAVGLCRELRERMRHRSGEWYSTASVYLAKFLDHLGPDEMRREALEVLEELVHPARETASPQRDGTVWRASYHQGILYRQLKKHRKAERILQNVLKRCTSPRLRTSSRHQLGVIALEQGELEKAERMFEKCLGEWADKPTEHRRIFELRRLAEVAERRGETARACELYRDAAALSQSLGLTRYHAELSQHHLRLDRPQPRTVSNGKPAAGKPRKQSGRRGV